MNLSDYVSHDATSLAQLASLTKAASLSLSAEQVSALDTAGAAS